MKPQLKNKVIVPKDCQCDDNAVFFQNIETEDTVWEVPKNGDLVEL